MGGLADASGDADPRYRETTERFLFFRLVTEVRADGVYVRLAPVQRFFRRIAPADVDTVAPASYSPGRYGGWHWGLRRSPGGNTVYRPRGDGGVELRLSDDTHLFIGSETPEALADAVCRVTATG